MIDTVASFLSNTISNTWEPIPELQRSDADVLIWFILQNNIAFVEPNHDPVFSALKPMDQKVITPEGKPATITYYSPSEPLTVMACTQQYQWCQPGEGNLCTAWNGSSAVDISSLSYSDLQVNLTKHVFYGTASAKMHLATIALGNEALLASTASGYGQAGSRLNDNQWIRELDHLTSIFWNTVQLTLSQAVIGSGVSERD
jgi:hypothetical protein